MLKRLYNKVDESLRYKEFLKLLKLGISYENLEVSGEGSPLRESDFNDEPNLGTLLTTGVYVRLGSDYYLILDRYKVIKLSSSRNSFISDIKELWDNHEWPVLVSHSSVLSEVEITGYAAVKYLPKGSAYTYVENIDTHLLLPESIKEPEEQTKGEEKVSNFKDSLNIQGSMAVDAAKYAAGVTVGRVINKKLAGFIKPKLPIGFKGAVDNPIVQAALANAVSLALIHYRPDDSKSQTVAKIMGDASMITLMDSFNFEELLDSITDGISIPGFNEATATSQTVTKFKTVKAIKEFLDSHGVDYTGITGLDNLQLLANDV